MSWVRRACLGLTLIAIALVFRMPFTTGSPLQYLSFSPCSAAPPVPRWRSSALPRFDAPAHPRRCTVPLIGVVATSGPPTPSLYSLCSTAGAARFPVIAVAADDSAPLSWPPVCNGITFVSVEQQRAMAANTSTALGRIASLILSTHGARKNLGFALALQNGACSVLDYSTSVSFTGNPPLETSLTATHDQLFGMRPRSAEQVFVNPYPSLSPSQRLWPRGLPMQGQADRNALCGDLIRLNGSVATRIAVMQPAVAGHPDVSVATAQLATEANVDYLSTLPHIVIDSGFAPYSSLAALHLAAGLWALYLPLTPHQRVGDVWRAYAAQSVFSAFGLRVAFVPPWVRRSVQKGNITEEIAAEQALHIHTETVGRVLSNYTHMRVLDQRVDSPSALDALIGAYVRLYEIGVIGADDVQGAITWAELILELGVEFPQRPLASIAPLSPRRTPCVEFPQVHTAVHINHNHWRAIGIWHGLFSSLYGSVSYHVQLNAESDAKRSPLPALTTFHPYVRLQTSGDDSYISLLDALHHSPELRTREALLWQHDDSFIHAQRLRAWLTNRSASVAVASSRQLPPVSEWGGYDWMWPRRPENQNAAKTVSAYAPHLCDEYATATNQSGGRVYFMRGQSDALALRLAAPRVKDFVAALHLMKFGDMFLEIAVPTAVTCSFRRSEIGPFPLWTAWDNRRTAGHAAAAFRKHGAEYAQYHPLKLNTPESVLEVMAMRDRMVGECK